MENAVGRCTSHPPPPRSPGPACDARPAGAKFGGNVLLPNISKGGRGVDNKKMHGELVSRLEGLDAASSRPGTGQNSQQGSRPGSRPRTAGSHRSHVGSRPVTPGGATGSRPKTPNPALEKVKHNHDIITSQSRPTSVGHSRPPSAGRMVLAPAMPHREKETAKSPKVKPAPAASGRGRGQESASPLRSPRAKRASKAAVGGAGGGGKRAGGGTMDLGVLKQLSDEVMHVPNSEPAP